VEQLRDLGIYGGAQGIWVDKAHTASPELGPDGVTVAILHTGRHYADDLSDDGDIYHYPTTSRPAARDAAEVQATKNAMVHRIPIFIVLPGAESQLRRSLKLGWVCDFDNENRQFLIFFGDEHPPSYSKAETAAESFQLEQASNRKASTINRCIVVIKPLAAFVPMRQLQAFLTPDSLDLLVIDGPAFGS